MSAALADFAGEFWCVNTQPIFAKNLPHTAIEKNGARRAHSALDTAKRVSDPEAARETVSRHLDIHTTNQQLPPPISSFLEDQWRSFLMRLNIIEGEHGENWLNALEKQRASSDMLADLRIGASVEFYNKRDIKRALRLKWISRQGNVYLFQDQHTNDELCVTATRLTQHRPQRLFRSPSSPFQPCASVSPLPCGSIRV